MLEYSLQWAIDPIHRWRDQTGNQNRVNSELFYDFQKKIEETEVSHGLIFFSILACEWLFRIKKAGQEEIQNLLCQIERNFRKIGDPEFAFYLTEAVRPRIEEIVSEEGRTLVSVGTHYPRRTYQTRHSEVNPTNRQSPQKIAPAKRGKIPLPGHWIAGVVLNFVLEENGSDNPELPLDLIFALSGKETPPDIKDFSKLKQNMSGNAFSEFVDQLKIRYDKVLKNHIEGAPWKNVLENEMNSGKPEIIFPSDPVLAKEILRAYSWD